MSLSRQIAWNTLVQIIGKIASTGLGLVALGMMTRYLGTEQFGWYTTVISFLGFAGIVIDLGLIPVSAQMFGEAKYGQTTLLQNLIAFRLVTAVIFFGLAPGLAWFMPYPEEVKIAISFTTISFLAIAVNQVLTGFYQNELKMHLPVIGENIGRVVLVAGLWLLMREGASFLPLMAVISLSSVAYTAFLWIAAARIRPASLAYDPVIWKDILKKSWPIAVSIIFNVIYLKGDILLLSLYRPQAEVGVYGAAYRVLDILSQTAMMIMGVMLPLLAAAWTQGKKEDFRARYQTSFNVMMLLAVPALVGIMVLSVPIMRLVAGAEFEYALSGRALAILALAVFGLYLGAVFGHAAVAINKQKATMWIYISDALITLCGYLIVIPRYGLWGAAWMTVFSEVYAGLLLAYVVGRHVKHKLRLITLGKIILGSGLMGLCLLAVRDWPVLGAVALGIAIYTGAIYLLRAVPRETLREVFSRAP